MFPSALCFVMQVLRLQKPHFVLVSWNPVGVPRRGLAAGEEEFSVFLFVHCFQVSSYQREAIVSCCLRPLPMLPEPPCNPSEIAVAPESACLMGQNSGSKRLLLQIPEVPAVAWHCPTLRPRSQLYVALAQLPILVTPTSFLRVEVDSCLSLLSQCSFLLFQPSNIYNNFPTSSSRVKIPSAVSVFLSQPPCRKTARQSSLPQTAQAGRESWPRTQGRKGCEFFL